MTRYSILPSQGRFTVIATWGGEDAASNSAKVTSFTDPWQANRCADRLTRLSEAMWDAAAWLDVYDAAEARIAQIIADARSADDIAAVGESLFAGTRHENAWTASDLIVELGTELPGLLNSLLRAQRLTIADELAADATARIDSLRLLPTGYDPEDDVSRIWQAADVARATRIGLTSANLPNGAARWLARSYDADRGPAERWGARTALHRIEQLAAALPSIGGRGGPELGVHDEPIAHLVLPAELFGLQIPSAPRKQATVIGGIHPALAGSALGEAYRHHATTTSVYADTSAIVYVSPDIDFRNTAPWERDVFAKLDVRLSRPGEDAAHLATLDAADSDGFAAALGEWTRSAAFRS